jgi:hypothetical protein
MCSGTVGAVDRGVDVTGDVTAGTGTGAEAPGGGGVRFADWATIVVGTRATGAGETIVVTGLEAAASVVTGWATGIIVVTGAAVAIGATTTGGATGVVA